MPASYVRAMSDEFEELEQIPWAALAAGSPSPRHRYVAVAAGLVVVLAAIGWLMTRSGGSAAISLAAPEVGPVPATPESLPATTPPATTAVYSEADLMLIDAGDEERLAVMQAEWLVRDVLTVDGDPLIEDRMAGLLPGIDRPETPAYVEWVKAFAVESVEPGRYRVEVAYRILTGTADGYVRQAPGALAVEISIDVGGSAGLVAPPTPVSLPALLISAG